jgi:hypothetical protein
MESPFNRENIGVPQVLAFLLLLAMFAQCAWFIAYVPLKQTEAMNVRAGLDYLGHRGAEFSASHSPLTALLASVPLRVLVPGVVEREYDQFFLDRHRWIIRFPFLMSGLFLGASLWYVARRLYGNTGGYLALLLYAFNPVTIAQSSFAEPDIVAAWGMFGAVFTAIAVAHTLYAPREVVLWNWRRILLLGFCVFLMVGAQFSTVWILLLALGFMLWAVPHRRPAALAIWISACVAGLVFLCGAYLFRIPEMVHGFSAAQWFPFSPAAVTSPLVYRVAGAFFANRNNLAPLVLSVLALLVFLTWRRTRFFGNTAPLLVGVLLTALGIVMPGHGLLLFFTAMPFLMVFASGVITDVLESDRITIALGIVMGVLVLQAITGIMGLALLSRTAR